MERAEEIYQRIINEGESAIDNFIFDRKSEELFLDFKRSADHGNGKRLHENDRKNLSKAVSGFGNSEGGIIVWGVECKKGFDDSDVAKAKFPIIDARRFVSWLNGAISGLTIPPHQGVQNYALLSEGSCNGFAITLIPKSNHAPHQTVNDLKYYIRAGSDFVPTPHQVLAGLFGRRPQPKPILFFIHYSQIVSEKIHLDLGFQIRNDGQGMAEDIYLNCILYSSPGDHCNIGFNPDPTGWTGNFSMGRILGLISKPSIRLAPEAHIQPVRMDIILKPPFNEKLKIEGSFGCSGAPISRFNWESSSDKIQKLYNEIMSKHQNGTLQENDWDVFTNRLLNTNQKE